MFVHGIPPPPPTKATFSQYPANRLKPHATNLPQVSSHKLYQCLSMVSIPSPPHPKATFSQYPANRLNHMLHTYHRWAHINYTKVCPWYPPPPHLKATFSQYPANRLNHMLQTYHRWAHINYTNVCPWYPPPQPRPPSVSTLLTG